MDTIKIINGSDNITVDKSFETLINKSSRNGELQLEIDKKTLQHLLWYYTKKDDEITSDTTITYLKNLPKTELMNLLTTATDWKIDTLLRSICYLIAQEIRTTVKN